MRLLVKKTKDDESGFNPVVVVAGTKESHYCCLIIFSMICLFITIFQSLPKR